MKDLDGFTRRLILTRRWRPAARAAALTATLPLAAPRERGDILRDLVTLLDRLPRGPLLELILQHWRFVPEDTRATCLRAAGPEIADHIDALRKNRAGAQASDLAAACLDASSILEPATLRRLLPTPGQLDDANEEVAAAAANALRSVAAHLGTAGQHRDALDEALAEAAATWPDHRRDEAIQAVLHAAHLAGPFLRTWLQDEHQPGHMALRAAAREVSTELTRRLAPHWLAIPALQATAIQWCELALDPADRRAMWRKAHLLGARGRADCLARVRGVHRNLPADDELEAAGPAGRLGYIRFLREAPVSRECRVKELVRFLPDEEARTRMVAAMDIGRMPPDRSADELLLDYCFDQDERVAATATLALTTIRTSRRRMWLRPSLEKLERSPHSEVRRLVETVLSRDAARAESRWHCPLREREAWRDEPETFLAELRRELECEDVDRRLHAMTMIHRFRLWEHFATQLREAARDPDPRIISKAVLLAARLDGDESDHVINAAIRHVDPRVHANAIEAKLMRRPSTSWIVRMRNDDVARARANVIRHIIRQTSGAACSQDILDTMLTDRRPAHRVSAVWVAERLNCQGLLPRIERMIHEDIPAVSTRAARCSRRLTTLGAPLEAAS